MTAHDLKCQLIQTAEKIFWEKDKTAFYCLFVVCCKSNTGANVHTHYIVWDKNVCSVAGNPCPTDKKGGLLYTIQKKLLVGLKLDYYSACFSFEKSILFLTLREIIPGRFDF